MGKQFYQNVNGIEEILEEQKKSQVDSKRNYSVSLIAAIASVLSLLVAVIALWRTW